jgi:transposase
MLNEAGEIVEESRIRTGQRALSQRFGGLDRARVVLEVGPRSPWISRLVAHAGHEVIAANPRKLPLI